MSALYFSYTHLDYDGNFHSLYFLKIEILYIRVRSYYVVRKKKCPSTNYHFQNCRGRHGSYSILNNPTGTNGHSTLHVRKVDSASIANMDKDCFIIPIAYLDRFLPDGVNVRTALLITYKL